MKKIKSKIEKHNCKNNLVEKRQSCGLRVSTGEKVIGIKYKCKVCGKEFGKIVTKDHPFFPDFYI